MAVLQSGSRSMCMKDQCTKLSFPFGGMSFAISASIMGAGSGRGSCCIGNFQKKRPRCGPLRAQKNPTLVEDVLIKRVADKSRILSRKDGERGRKSREDCSSGGKPQRKEVVEESGGGLVKRLQPRLATTLFGRRAQ